MKLVVIRQSKWIVTFWKGQWDFRCGKRRPGQQRVHATSMTQRYWVKTRQSGNQGIPTLVMLYFPEIATRRHLATIYYPPFELPATRSCHMVMEVPKMFSRSESQRQTGKKKVSQQIPKGQKHMIKCKTERANRKHKKGRKKENK